MLLADYIQSKRGNATALAAELGVSLSYLSQMAAGTAAISPARCVAIEEFTMRRVTRKELREDWASIWPPRRPVNPKARAKR